MFIQLNRLFNQVPTDHTSVSKGDDIDLTEFYRFQTGGSLNWEDLLNEHRVIVLAEAGAGKT